MLSVRRATVNYLIAGFDYWLFLSTPSVRRATLHLWPVLRSIRHFYPRPPRGGRRHQHKPSRGFVLISIHALREEGDLPPIPSLETFKQFLSTPSARRATRKLSAHSAAANFYPRPPRGGRRGLIGPRGPSSHFYPRPPRGGRLMMADLIGG